MTDSIRRARRTFTEGFKKQMVLLHQNGKPRVILPFLVPFKSRRF